MQKLEAYSAEFPTYKAQRLREREEQSYDLRSFTEEELSILAIAVVCRIDSVWRQPTTAHLYLDESRLPPYPPLDVMLAHIPQLADRDKIVLTFSYMAGKTNREIGEVLHITPQRVGQIKKRAQHVIEKFFSSKIAGLEKIGLFRFRSLVRALIPAIDTVAR